MNEELAWLAENVIEWSNDLDRVGICSTGVHWFSAEAYPSEHGFTREEWQTAREQLGLADPESFPASTLEEDEAWAEAERRMDLVGQNGPTGCHYNPEDMAFVRSEGKQPRYQDATGEDWIDEAARTFTPEEFRGAMRFSIGKYNRRMGKKDELIKEIEKMKDYCQRWIDVEKGR